MKACLELYTAIELFHQRSHLCPWKSWSFPPKLSSVAWLSPFLCSHIVFELWFCPLGYIVYSVLVYRERLQRDHTRDPIELQYCVFWSSFLFNKFIMVIISLMWSLNFWSHWKVVRTTLYTSLYTCVFNLNLTPLLPDYIITYLNVLNIILVWDTYLVFFIQLWLKPQQKWLYLAFFASCQKVN